MTSTKDGGIIEKGEKVESQQQENWNGKKDRFVAEGSARCLNASRTRTANEME